MVDASIVMDKLELEFALSSTHEQFQNLVLLHIKNVIESLCSRDEETAKKASTLLTHVCKRLNLENNTKLPINNILDLASIHSPFTKSQKNVILLVLEIGYKHASLKESLESLPRLLDGINERDISSKALIIGIVYSIIAQCSKLDSSMELVFKKAIIDTGIDNIKYLMSLITILMIYDVPDKSLINPNFKFSEVSYLGDLFMDICLRRKNAWVFNVDELINLKVGIVNVIAKNKVFDRNEFSINKILILLCASSNTHSDVSSLAKLCLKSCSQSALLNSAELVTSLVHLYTGNLQHANIGPSALAIQVPQNVKISILTMLQKTRSFYYAPYSCEIIFDEILYTHPTQKDSKYYIELLTLGIHILHDPVSQFLKNKFDNAIKIFLDRLEVCNKITDVRLERVRLLLFEIIAILSKKLGDIGHDIDAALLKLLEGLCFETRPVRSVVRSYFMDLFPIIKDKKIFDDMSDFVLLLCTECIKRDIPESLYCLLMLANTIIRSKNVEYVYLNIDAIQRSRHGLKQAGLLGLEFPDPPVPTNVDEIPTLISHYRSQIPDFLTFIALLRSIMIGHNPHNLLNYHIMSAIECTKNQSCIKLITADILLMGLEYARKLFIISADPWANRICIGKIGKLSSEENWIEEHVTMQRISEYTNFLNYNNHDPVEDRHKQQLGSFDEVNVDDISLIDEFGTPDQLNSSQMGTALGSPYSRSKKDASPSIASFSETSELLSLKIYIHLLIDTLKSPQVNVPLTIVCVHILFELVIHLPANLLELLENEIPMFLDILKLNNVRIQTGVAGILAEITVKDLEKDENRCRITTIVSSFLDELNIEPFTPEKMKSISLNSGAMIALGSIVGRLIRDYKNKAADYITGDKMMQIMEILSSGIISLQNSSIANLKFLCIAISEACRYQRIYKWSFVSQTEINMFSNSISNIQTGIPVQNYTSTPLKLAKKLMTILESHLDIDSQEHALITLCDIFVDSNLMREVLLSYLISLIPKATSNMRFLIIIGESICKIISGRNSILYEKYFFIPNTSWKIDESEQSIQFRMSTRGEYFANIALNRLITALNNNPNMYDTVYQGHLVIISCVARLCANEEVVRSKFLEIFTIYAKNMNNHNSTTHMIALDTIHFILKSVKDAERRQMISILNENIGYKNRTKLTLNNTSMNNTTQVITTLAAELNSPELVHTLLSILLNSKSYTSRYWVKTNDSYNPKMTIKNMLSESKYVKLLIYLLMLKFHPVPETSRELEIIFDKVFDDKKHMFRRYSNDICDQIYTEISTSSSYIVKKCSCDAIKSFVTTIGSVDVPPIVNKILDIYFQLYRILSDNADIVKASAFAAARELCGAFLDYLNDNSVNVTTRTNFASKLLSILSEQAQTSDIKIERHILSTICKFQGCNVEVVKPSLLMMVNTLIEHFSAFSNMNNTSSKILSATTTNSFLRSMEKYTSKQIYDQSNVEEINNSPFMNSLVKLFNMLPQDSAQEIVHNITHNVNESSNPTIEACRLVFLTKVSNTVKTDGT